MADEQLIAMLKEYIQEAKAETTILRVENKETRDHLTDIKIVIGEIKAGLKADKTEKESCVKKIDDHEARLRGLETSASILKSLPKLIETVDFLNNNFYKFFGGTIVICAILSVVVPIVLKSIWP